MVRVFPDTSANKVNLYALHHDREANSCRNIKSFSNSLLEKLIETEKN